MPPPPPLLPSLQVGLAALFTGIDLSSSGGFGVMPNVSTNLRNGLIVWLSFLGAYVVAREVVTWLLSRWNLRHRTACGTAERTEPGCGTAERTEPGFGTAERTEPGCGTAERTEPGCGDLASSSGGDGAMQTRVAVLPPAAAAAAAAAAPLAADEDVIIVKTIASEDEDPAGGVKTATEAAPGTTGADDASAAAVAAAAAALMGKVEEERSMAAALMGKAEEEHSWAWGALAWAALAVLFSVLVASGTLGGASLVSQEVIVSGLMANGSTLVVGSGSSSGSEATMGRVSLLSPPPPFPPAPPPPSPPSLPPPRAPRTTGANSSKPNANCSLYLATPFQLAKLGNGWCDAGAPFNTADCGWVNGGER